jgi:hypothetical protein
VNFDHANNTEIQISALKGEENQVLNFWILIKSIKKQRNKSVTESNSFEIGMENILDYQSVIKNRAKIEKISSQLIDCLHLDNIINSEEMIQTIINQV